jgi:hypothetical protein
MKQRVGKLLVLMSVILLHLSACTPGAWWANLTTRVPLISGAAAAEQALTVMRMVKPGVPEVVQPPTVVDQQLVTWDTARQIYGPDMPQIPGRPGDSLVWVVEVRGEWLVGMDAPGIETRLTPYHRGLVVLDAHTGASIAQMLRP